MSFEQKIRNDLERDKFNINYHLNTSLEAEGISVSEDLIRRTMDAIKLNEVSDSDMVKDTYGHKRPFYLRHAKALVSLAAAALLLFVGFSAFKNFPYLGKKDMNAENSAKYDYSGSTEKFSLATREASDDSVAYQTTEEGNEAAFKADLPADAAADTGADVGTLDSKLAIARDNNGEGDVENGETQDLDMLTAADAKDKMDETQLSEHIASYPEYMLTFTDIAVTEAAFVKEIKVTSNATADFKIINDEEEIDAFYSVMTHHSFMHSTEADEDILYIINITSEDKEEQINIGETVLTVDITHDDTAAHSVYSVADHSLLLKDISDLLGE